MPLKRGSKRGGRGGRGGRGRGRGRGGRGKARGATPREQAESRRRSRRSVVTGAKEDNDVKNCHGCNQQYPSIRGSSCDHVWCLTCVRSQQSHLVYYS